MIDLIKNYSPLIVALTVAIIFFIWLGWKIRLWWKNFLFMLLRNQGKKGERNSIKFLERNGYKIIDKQIQLNGYFFIDGALTEFDLRPDLLVEKGGAKYIAEIKTGDVSDPKNRNTRRQLHEYSYYSGIENILLVNPMKKSIQTVSFEKPS